MLKREYGGDIDIYRRLGGSTDHLTGEVTINKEVINVRRAIILTAKVIRKSDRPINVISANKTFTIGGTYDNNTRLFIIDRRNVPELSLKEFQLTEDDWIVYNGIKYEIKNFELIEFDAAWAITAQAVIGDVPEQIFLLKADNFIRMSQGSTI
jgi:hypothetical protein